MMDAEAGHRSQIRQAQILVQSALDQIFDTAELAGSQPAKGWMEPVTGSGVMPIRMDKQ